MPRSLLRMSGALLSLKHKRGIGLRLSLMRFRWTCLRPQLKHLSLFCLWKTTPSLNGISSKSEQTWSKQSISSWYKIVLLQVKAPKKKRTENTVHGFPLSFTPTPGAEKKAIRLCSFSKSTEEKLKLISLGCFSFIILFNIFSVKVVI